MRRQKEHLVGLLNAVPALHLLPSCNTRAYPNHGCLLRHSPLTGSEDRIDAKTGVATWVKLPAFALQVPPLTTLKL